MRNTIELEIKDVFVTDFNTGLPEPALMESMEGGIRVMFNDINELKKYQETLLLQNASDEYSQQNQLVSKLNSGLNRALLDNQIILDSIKAFAEALFSFIFGAEAHRQDKITIFETMTEGVRESKNSWELQNTLETSTYELGILTFDHRLTFYNFAHNQIDFNYEKIRDRLLKDLAILKLGLT